MTRFTTLLLLILPGMALAHEGHGTAGMLHHFGAEHLAPIVLPLIAAAGIARWLWLRSQR